MAAGLVRHRSKAEVQRKAGTPVHVGIMMRAPKFPFFNKKHKIIF